MGLLRSGPVRPGSAAIRHSRLLDAPTLHLPPAGARGSQGLTKSRKNMNAMRQFRYESWIVRPIVQSASGEQPRPERCRTGGNRLKSAGAVMGYGAGAHRPVAQQQCTRWARLGSNRGDVPTRLPVEAGIACRYANPTTWVKISRIRHSSNSLCRTGHAYLHDAYLQTACLECEGYAYLMPDVGDRRDGVVPAGAWRLRVITLPVGRSAPVASHRVSARPVPAGANRKRISERHA